MCLQHMVRNMIKTVSIGIFDCFLSLDEVIHSFHVPA